MPRLADVGRGGAIGSGKGLLGKTNTPSPHAGQRSA